MKITILGCGASAGVPLIGCDCEVCRSDDPKNNRTRPSILVEENNARILIDTSPDLRQQCLRHDIRQVDAILYTHGHADHVHGLDDVRSLNFHKQAPIPIFTNEETLKELQQRFAYAFLPPIPEYGWFRPCFEPNLIRYNTPFTVAGVEIMPFRQHHGKIDSIGFRIGGFVYSTDAKAFPVESQTYLKNIDTWLVDCLRYEDAPTHAHLPLSLDWIESFKPKRAILTHLSHDFDYKTLQRTTPDNVTIGYDGMEFELS